MSKRSYLCSSCGVIRRANAVYIDPRQETWAEAMASARWPKHCGQPMKPLTLIQVEVVTQLRQKERVKWVAKGMHILRQRQHGNRKWKPAIVDWQIEEARRQKAAYFVKLEENARLWRRRIPARVHKRRRWASGAEEA